MPLTTESYFPYAMSS